MNEGIRKLAAAGAIVGGSLALVGTGIYLDKRDDLIAASACKDTTPKTPDCVNTLGKVSDFQVRLFEDTEKYAIPLGVGIVATSLIVAGGAALAQNRKKVA